MTFPIPPKQGNPVCEECLTATPDKYHECDAPCSWLVSFASHEAKARVVEVAGKLHPEE